MDNLLRQDNVSELPYVEKNQKRTAQGILYEQPTIVNPLPAIGTYFTIYECIVKTKPRKAEKVDFYPFLVDTWKKPILFRVKEYTQGIDNPYNGSNFLVAEYKFIDKIVTMNIPSRLIVCGHYRVKIEEGVSF